MIRSRWLSLLAAVCAGALTQAQSPLPTDINFFADELAQKLPDEGRGRFFTPSNGSKPQKADGFQHTLVFQNGRQFRGELSEITKDEIVWKRADAKTPLRFPRSEIRRVLLTDEVVAGSPFMQFTPAARGKKAEDKTSGEPATIKLPGSDWLFGNVLSADGETFGLDLGANANLTVTRSQIEWLHFGPNPAPAFGFAGSALSMEGWLPNSANMVVEKGVLTVRDAAWIGRAISPPDRFEVAFEIPHESEEGLRLWLQPFGPQVNCYGTGTVELKFGSKQISRLLYLEKFERKSEPLPAEAQAEQGPVSYRVFYDGIGQRVSVWRNNRQLGDWEFSKKAEPQANAANRVARQTRINGICFDREVRGSEAPPLKFNRLRIQPWDGVANKPGEAAPSGDQLSIKEAATIAGRLESITDKELIFSGAANPRKEATMVRLNPPIATMPDANTLVMLGKKGEFGAADVELSDEKLTARTVFAPKFEVPASALSGLNFPSHDMPAARKTDMLVFKNSDEFPGTLLTAEQGGGLRWKMISGQEVEFQPGRIAGVRFAAPDKPVKPAAAATIELRNGDQLRGELSDMDAERLRLRHPQLGAIAIDRSKIARFFPNSRTEIHEGSRDPDGWLGSQGSTEEQSNARSWVYLDGVYVMRSENRGNSFGSNEARGIHREISADLERFEVRGEMTFINGGSGNCSLQIAGKAGGSMQATFSLEEVQIIAYSPRGQQPNWKTIPFRDKLSEASTRLAVRLFVDTKAGKTDLYVNGVPIARTGQTAADRMSGPCSKVSFQSYSNGGTPVVFSSVWIGPWTGELPRAGAEQGPVTALANGDATAGAPKEMHDGKLSLETEIGPLDLPIEKVHCVDFGAATPPEKAVARLRLVDGGTIHVSSFRWDGQEIAAHSPVLGEFRLPVKAVSELIYDPAPIRPPVVAAAKKLAQKAAPDAVKP